MFIYVVNHLKFLKNVNAIRLREQDLGNLFFLSIRAGSIIQLSSIYNNLDEIHFLGYIIPNKLNID